jgi:hypothetical protein
MRLIGEPATRRRIRQPAAPGQRGAGAVELPPNEPCGQGGTEFGAGYGAQAGHGNTRETSRSRHVDAVLDLAQSLQRALQRRIEAAWLKFWEERLRAVHEDVGKTGWHGADGRIGRCRKKIASERGLRFDK